MKTQKGIVTLIFLLIMSLIATLVLVIGQSRLLLSLQRGKSASDTILTSYQAEYEINQILGRLFRGNLKESDFANFPITKNLSDNFKVTIDGEIEGTNQIVNVTATRSFAVSQIQAIRAVETADSVSELDLVLLLDCTGSMDGPSSPTSRTSRMYEQREAAKRFINQIKNHTNGDFIHVGVATFQTNQNWMKTTDGREIIPSNKISKTDIYNAIDQGFGNTRAESIQKGACVGEGWTNLGGAFNFAQEYFKTSPLTKAEKVEVLITDGEPTARTLDAACTPNLFCENCYGTGNPSAYLSCAASATTRQWKSGNFGKRDPDTTAFAITVLNPPFPDIKKIIEDAIGAENYFQTSNATDISAKLDIIFNRVVTSLARTTISRVIPVSVE